MMFQNQKNTKLCKKSLKLKKNLHKINKLYILLKLFFLLNWIDPIKLSSNIDSIGTCSIIAQLKYSQIKKMIKLLWMHSNKYE